jgi:type 1 glutamine amidotransferase/nicotinamidase-related amidase
MSTLPRRFGLLMLFGLGLAPFHESSADGPARLKVVLLSGAEEYDSDRSLTAFAKHLEATRPVTCVLLKAEGDSKLSGLEALEDADVALFFTRRLKIEGEELRRIKAYVAAGKPIVAVRTASHGFQNWLEFDKDVLGGNYRGHYTNDISQRAKPAEGAAGHPVLDGVRGIASLGSLYKAAPIAADATLLLVSKSPEAEEPAAWVRERNGQRVFYTSLGAQGDFDHAGFRRMLVNALFWAANRPVTHAEPATPAEPPKAEGTLTLQLRGRVEAVKGSGLFADDLSERKVPVSETAIVICDMWDKHWCSGATGRCGAIAARMEPVLAAARAKGIRIIHAPSDCMDFYDGTPQRIRIQRATKVTPPASSPSRSIEPPLPIDDKDGGCDTDDSMYLAWTRQSPLLTVAPEDGVSESGPEIYNFLRQQGIKNLLIMGVHTNMCIMNRSFAIKQMTRWGIDCVLVRDLTDAMYDPKDRPYVPHDEGTNLVIRHIEAYWCPSTTSAELLEGLPR